MGRQREFEPEQALEKAMQLFWQKGYFDTSIEELVGHTGVSRKGLYSTFGNKHDLYIKTLKFYHQLYNTQLLKVLDTPNANLTEINTFFAQTYTMLDTPSGQFGCFICNAAHELAMQDEEVRAWVESHWNSMNSLFQKALYNAKSNGQLNSHVDPQQYANYLTGVLRSLANLMRCQSDPQVVKDYFDISLASINVVH